MRKYIGFFVSLALSLALVGALFALAPASASPEKLRGATQSELAKAAHDFDAYPFTPLVSNFRVISRSWSKWVREGSAQSDIFAMGAEGVEHTRVYLAATIIAGPFLLLFATWLGGLLSKIRSTYVGGRAMLLTLAAFAASIGLAALPAEDVTGLAFGVPTLIGWIVWFATRKKAAPAQNAATALPA